MAYVDFVMKLHLSTKRDYVQRVVEYDKAECAVVAKQYGKDYWDGDRRYGYGGYSYDGRWRPIAEAMAKHYGLKSGDKILDIGCGKGYLLYEFTQVVPGIEVAGVDISEYGIENSKDEVKPFLKVGSAVSLDFPDNTFDFVVTLGTFHNLVNYDLRKAIMEVERVGKGEKKHIMVESYRNDSEMANLLYWQLTCQSFRNPKEWEWEMEQAGYHGDYSYIVFE